ncbi:unnamed protein product [Nezara viridula]|uniref:Uncharacterized protein n=1 Tax=Nezara viridula TaxID=85310 RepID=A0A9P0MXS0_NEZVI|nr:unnamed protein product [Nezara viridula]
MVTAAPSQQYPIEKVEMVFKDIFKFSRVFSTFPIDNEYSDISKFNIAKGIVLYLLADIFGFELLYRFSIHENFIMGGKIVFALQTIPAIMFYWIHIAWLIRNKSLFKELYDELKDIEHILWESGICWFYKPAWCTKYLSLTAMIISGTLWDILDDILNPEEQLYNMIFIALISVINQYAILVQVMLSILREIRTIEESETVIKLTDKLLAVCQKVNTFYEPQIFFYIVIVYLLILSTIYGMAIEVETLSLISSIWLLSFVSPLIHIIICVDYFSHEVIL